MQVALHVTNASRYYNATEDLRANTNLDTQIIKIALILMYICTKINYISEMKIYITYVCAQTNCKANGSLHVVF